MCRKIMVYNISGGTGKTTISLNLTAALAQVGFRCLLVELDSQSNVSHGLKLKEFTGMRDLILSDRPVRELVQTVPDSNYDVLLNYNLFWLDLQHVVSHIEFGPNILALRLSELEPDYDFIIIDSSPTMSLMVTWAMSYCDWVLIPILLRTLSFVGLKHMRSALKKYARGDDTIIGIVPTMTRARVTEFDINRTALIEVMGADKVAPDLRQDQWIATAQILGKDIIQYRPGSNGAKDILALMIWLLQAITSRKAACHEEKNH